MVESLHHFHIYSENDVKAVCTLYSARRGTAKTMQGRISCALKPVVDTYNALDSKNRSLFRREIRSFVKWYGYISQITRMFDRALHEEYLFCSYLSKLLPSDPTAPIDLDNNLRLEFYKLEQTFEGSIELEKKQTALPPPAVKPASPKPDDKRSLLDEVIAAINEKYQGDFTEADRVIIGDLLQRLLKDDRLRRIASSADPKIFMDSQFPKFFEEIAQQAYVENTESYTSLFEDKAKYQAIMSILASAVIRECRNAERG